ncbi:MAG: DUF885 domain-containing protein, partial [Rubrivivax sp.]|nr:DUF885 domain-containing protein [Rubrivivax sp.]
MITLRQPWARLLRAGLLAAAAGLAGLAAAADDTATKALHALFDRHWQWSAETFPEFATYRGDHRYGDRLSDVSPEALAERDRRTAQFLAEARAIPADGLSATDRVSREMFVLSQQRFLEIAAFPAARGMSLRALGGPQTQLAELLQVSPVGNVQQVNQLLARLAAYPRRMDQEIALLRASAAAGWVPARDVLQRVLVQLDAQLADDPEKTPFWTPFRRLGSGIAADERSALQRAGREAIAAQVQPALRRLRALVADELLPRAPQDGSLTRYPGGDRWYALQVRLNTTTDLTPQQIHDIGQRELSRLRGEMEAVMRELKFEGGFDRFVQHLNTDPRFFHTSPQALLAGYREIAKRLDAEMPKLFAELPRAPYGVAEMPAHMGPNRAEYYNGPALDGSRAGFFFANTMAFRQRPIWGMETLVAHEAMPGHHLQIARATELRGLPNFRRSGFGYTAFSEGWALYAETLGFELGLYTDPYSRFGHLQWQA